MLKRQKESRAFWVLLIWTLLVPVFLNSDLAAQDENLDDFIVSEEESLPDQAASEKNASVEEAGGEATTDDIAEDVGGEGEEEAAEPEEETAEGQPDEPALSADPNELLSKVNGPYRAKKFDAVVKELGDFEDAVATSKELSEIYVESLINSKKPDWNGVNRAARALSRLDRKSSLADYAIGLFYQNKSKPDSARALTYFSKAKSAKKPHPDAAMAYYMALLKKFWMVLAAAIVLPIILIANKIKKKKAAKAAAAAEGEEEAGADLQNELQAAISGEDEKTAEGEKTKEADKKPEEKKEKAAESKKAPAKKVPAKKVAKKSGPEAKTAEPSKPVAAPAETPATQSQTPPVAEPVEAPATQPTAAAEPAKPVAEPVEAPAIQPPPAANQPQHPQQPVAPPPYPQQPYQQPYPQAYPPPYPQQQAVPPHHYDSLTAKRQAEIEQARNLIGAQRREPVAADPELETLWSELCRKALKSKINPHARSSYESDSAPQSSAKLSMSNSSLTDETRIDPNVSIDLSEEALKDDLIGKLKMLAISDGELRSLLNQKNPAHIPHLIEYVLSRPEPVRLSLVARELGNYNDPAVIDTLASLLYHEDNRVALAAIQGLENSKNPQAILHICPFLKSDTPLLAQAGRTALSNFGAVKILKAFVKLPQHPDAKIREAGVFVLSRMKGAQVEQLLVEMLNDDVAEIREKVILAMSYQKNPVYIDPLREFFRIAAGEDKALARKAIVYLQGFANKKK
ncbi:MAG: hypothetical protein PWR01_2535 [Clostridiales bacterium]|nr:hypothetical protein [Clostridiales bacterium]MDN5281462.1 hypothetical protein [Candidatus Ozemobacter sp.]